MKPSESEKTLAVVSRNLFVLVRRFRENSAVNSLHSYKLLCRVLEEQCTVVEKRGEEGPTELAVSVKSVKEIRSSSLQNPSDPRERERTVTRKKKEATPEFRDKYRWRAGPVLMHIRDRGDQLRA